MTNTLKLTLFLGVAAAAQSVLAHHSSIGIYDTTRLIEVEGVVTSVLWRNPHPSYTLAVEDDNGETVDWRIEAGSISTLRVMGIGRDFIAVGDRVTLAGEPSLRGRPELFARNLLLDDGREVFLSAASKPYWSEGDAERLYEAGVDAELAERGRQAATGIFRVWARVPNDPDSWPLYRDDVAGLTAAAEQIRAQWDPAQSPYLGCAPKGLPYVMGSAYPMEFVPQGEDILVRLEESDARRLIHMNSDAAPREYSMYGYSTGRWEEDTLIVETTHIDTPHFYGDGTPQSRRMRLIEYFSLSDDESRLNYRLVVDDPETFTEIREFTRYWAWRPDLTVEPYNCQP
ncbi:MAG: DUF6152 family protein [Gammaproteobacteria bacterium]|nr:DUF6152 family protein [Gammaproteobacteria bacterium]MDH3506870.1 DUF6152 family protein [Gammaproteobacteria bacterium]